MVLSAKDVVIKYLFSRNLVSNTIKVHKNELIAYSDSSIIPVGIIIFKKSSPSVDRYQYLILLNQKIVSKRILTKEEYKKLINEWDWNNVE